MNPHRFLPSALQGLLPVQPDPHDHEYASSIRDDGTIETSWSSEGHDDNALITTVAGFPRITTPATLELAAEILRDTDSARKVEKRLRRRIAYDRRRYPLTFARLVDTEGARRAAELKFAELSHRERQAGHQAAAEARERFRSEHASEYQAAGVVVS